MLMKLQRDLGVTFLFITHDLAVAKHFAWEGRIGVMYLGRMAELASTPKLIREPVHPYTRALISALPEADPRQHAIKNACGCVVPNIPSLLHLPEGCTFHPRCPMFEPGLCDQLRPAEDVVQLADHLAACFVAAREAGQVDRIPLELRDVAQQVTQSVA